MMSIDAWHPEVETFIKIKENPNKINKANLSVEVDNDFMTWVADEGNDSAENSAENSIYANHIFNTICESAWKSAEPGIIFTNRFRNYNLMEFVDEYAVETCNPCGRRFPHVKHRSKSGKAKCFNIC